MNDEKFAVNFETKTIKALDLLKISKRKRVLVAASGGKDSTSLLFLLKKLNYGIEALTVNAHIGNYSEDNLNRLKKFCTDNKIKLHEVSFMKEFGFSLPNLMSILEKKKIKKTSCSVCGALRRYLLNKYAKKLKADVLITGHNLDDESNGILVSIFTGKPSYAARTGPLIKNKHFIPKAKPYYFISENEIERYSKINNFDVCYEWCPHSNSGMRRFISELKLNNSEKMNLIKNTMKFSFCLKKSSKKIKKCENCGEPSANLNCQACSILNLIKND